MLCSACMWISWMIMSCNVSYYSKTVDTWYIQWQHCRNRVLYEDTITLRECGHHVQSPDWKEAMNTSGLVKHHDWDSSDHIGDSIVSLKYGMLYAQSGLLSSSCDVHVLNMKQGTCIINIILWNVLVRILYLYIQ